ncbi:hypothetical protein C8Q77DRAFT_1068999 [Trametes polyzona]|nr:hypothetical protein C8Q77DRAFT_1068999 [Trametes polyzona]
MRSSMLASLVVFLASSAVNAAVLTGSSGATLKCENEVVVSETFIGEEQNVKLTHSHCDDAPFVTAQGNVVSSLTKRQGDPSNVCGAQCNTFCFNPAGGGPNEDDCAVIANALLFDSQNGKPLFNATASGTGTEKVTMQFHSCTTYFLNQASTDLTYCRSDWSSLVTWLASDCNAANNAHGGLCVAADQRWYVQVQHSDS